MTKLGDVRAVAEDTGLHGLDRTVWQAKAGIVGLAIGAALVTFIALPNRGPLSLLVGLTSAFLAVAYFLARELIGRPAEIEAATPQLKRPSFLPARRTDEAAQAEAAAVSHMPSAPAGAQSAAGFLQRFQRSLVSSENEAEATASEVRARRLGGYRRGAVQHRSESSALAAAPPPKAGNMALLKPNDLRHYLNQRLAVPASKDAGAARKVLAREPASGEPGTVLTSLDAVLDHVLALGQGAAPRALLVGGISAMVDATAEAISLARAIVPAGDRVVLIDLARGPISVSGALDLPRSPGLTDLSARRARFEDTIRIDAETPLQVITAGTPALTAADDENERFTPIFEALTETYDSVVLHADCEALRKCTPALRFELPVAVAVLRAGTSMGDAGTDLSAFSALGCPVVVYEQGVKEQRPRFLGWAAAV